MNPKHKLFVAALLSDPRMEQQKAAVKAGYSAKTAAQAASRMMKHPDVAVALSKAVEARAERCEVTQDLVVQELSKMAFAKLHNPEDWSPKIRALELLGKHMGMFVDRAEISHRVERPLKELSDEELDARIQA